MYWVAITIFQSECKIFCVCYSYNTVTYKTSVCSLLCLSWITSKDLLYSMWDSDQCYVAGWMGGKFEGGMDICICVAKSLSYSLESITTLLTEYTSIGCTTIQNKKFKIKKFYYFYHFMDEETEGCINKQPCQKLYTSTS